MIITTQMLNELSKAAYENDPYQNPVIKWDNSRHQDGYRRIANAVLIEREKQLSAEPGPSR